MKRRARADAATVDRRVDWVVTEILSGRTSRTIIRNAAKRKDFKGLSDRSLSDYLRKAREEIRTRGEFDKTDEFAKAISRLEQLYAMALEDRNVAAARAVVRDLMNLFGIEGPIHVKVEGGITVTTFADVARLAAQRREQQDQAAPDA